MNKAVEDHQEPLVASLFLFGLLVKVSDVNPGSFASGKRRTKHLRAWELELTSILLLITLTTPPRLLLLLLPPPLLFLLLLLLLLFFYVSSSQSSLTGSVALVMILYGASQWLNYEPWPGRSQKPPVTHG